MQGASNLASTIMSPNNNPQQKAQIPSDLYLPILLHASQPLVFPISPKNRGSSEAFQRLLLWSFVSVDFAVACRKIAFREIVLGYDTSAGRISQINYRAHALLDLIEDSWGEEHATHSRIPLHLFVKVLRVVYTSTPLIPRIVKLLPSLRSLLYRLDSALEATNDSWTREKRKNFSEGLKLVQGLKIGEELPTLVPKNLMDEQVPERQRVHDSRIDFTGLNLDRVYLRLQRPAHNLNGTNFLLKALHLMDADMDASSFPIIRPSESASAAQRNVTIKRLELHDCSGSIQIALMLEEGRRAFTSVKELILTLEDGDELKRYMPLLGACQGNLGTLELAFKTGLVPERPSNLLPPSIPDILNLTVFPNLTKVLLVNYPFDPTNRPALPGDAADDRLNDIRSAYKTRAEQSLYLSPDIPTLFAQFTKSNLRPSTTNACSNISRLTSVHIATTWEVWAGFGGPGFLDHLDKVTSTWTKLTRLIENPTTGKKREGLENLNTLTLVIYVKTDSSALAIKRRRGEGKWDEALEKLGDFMDRVLELKSVETKVVIR